MQVSRPHPSDHPLLILFVVGGITVSEAKMVKDLVPSLKPGTQVLSPQQVNGKSRRGPFFGLPRALLPAGSRLCPALLLSHLLLPPQFHHSPRQPPRPLPPQDRSPPGGGGGSRALPSQSSLPLGFKGSGASGPVPESRRAYSLGCPTRASFL